MALEGHGKPGQKERVGYLAEGLTPGKSVELLGASVLEGDPAAQVTNNNGILGKFKRIRLSPQGFSSLEHSPFEFLMRPPQGLLRPLTFGDDIEYRHKASSSRAIRRVE